jgi:capsular polysaccharide biosynthesis protein
MDSPRHGAPARLRLGTALRAHLLIVIILALFGANLMAAVSLLLPKDYTATASILVRPLDGNPFSPNAQGSDLTNLETEAQIVTSDIIVDQVRRDLSPDYGQPNLTKGVSVVVSPNTQILMVSYRHPRPETAVAVSSAFANAYLDYRLERRNASITSQRASLVTRIQDVEARARKLRRENRPVDDPEVRSVAGQLLNLQLQKATLDSAETTPGEVIRQTDGKRSGLTIPLLDAILAGLLGGLVAGGALALLRERRVEVLRTVDDVEHLGVPVLGHVTEAASQGTSPSDAALMVSAVLRRRLTQPAIVAVSSVREAEGVDSFATDLALALAQGRQSVLLIDAHSTEATTRAGLSEVLANPSSLLAVARSSKDGYAQVGVGKQPESGQRWYATARMDEALQLATTKYDWVVVHAEGIDHNLGRSIVAACPYWVPTVTLGRTSRDDLERGLAWADTTGSRAVGLVAVNDVRAGRRDAERRTPLPTDD